MNKKENERVPPFISKGKENFAISNDIEMKYQI